MSLQFPGGGSLRQFLAVSPSFSAVKEDESCNPWQRGEGDSQESVVSMYVLLPPVGGEADATRLRWHFLLHLIWWNDFITGALSLKCRGRETRRSNVSGVGS